MRRRSSGRVATCFKSEVPSTHAFMFPVLCEIVCHHAFSNVWAWAEKDLRRAEKKEDTFTTFKWRVAHVSKRYPNSAALVPSMAKRIAECMKRKGANIGK